MTRKRTIIAGILGLIFLLALDQWTKYLAIAHLRDQSAIILIPGVLELQYLENFGAAFGILQNQRWLFVLLCCIFLAVAVYFYGKLPSKKE